jgi:GNAT superfamily N-acetyltransferase
MITELTGKDTAAIFNVINSAAAVYKGVIPEDCYHQPYMPLEELKSEMKKMTFYGWRGKGELIGVIGYQPIKDVTLIRHAYVLPEHQRKGIGSRLLEHIRGMTNTRQLLVGTWADAVWAINFYKHHGFKLRPDKDFLLQTYWTISKRQIDISVVLAIEL